MGFTIEMKLEGVISILEGMNPRMLETLLNLVPYSGYPVVQQAVRIAGEEFAKRPE
jgi:flagellar motor component MotA